MSAQRSFRFALAALPLLPLAAATSHAAGATRLARHAKRRTTMLRADGEAHVEVNHDTSDLPTPWGLNGSLTDTAVGVYNVMRQVTAYSWEWGTQTEVATELFYPQLSVFNPECPFPLKCKDDWSGVKVSLSVSQDETAPVPTEVFKVIDPILANHSHTPYPQPLIDGDGAAGDPTSLGMAALLGGAINTTNSSFYTVPAAQQLEYLLNNVSRNWDDGISQRDDSPKDVQFWTDNGYMSPPFLAYYGALEGNFSLLALAHQQYAAYRNVMMDNSTGYWHHIMLGSWNDTGFWSTGEGWTASGMMRVLASLAHVPATMKPATLPLRTDIHTWAVELLSAVWDEQDSTTGLLPNYFAGEKNASDVYIECAGTSMLAAASLRLAALTGDEQFVPAAELAMSSILENNINGSYVLAPVVNPLAGWNQAGPLKDGVSAEAEGFVVAMIAAWRDLQSAKNEGKMGWALSLI